MPRIRFRSSAALVGVIVLLGAAIGRAQTIPAPPGAPLLPYPILFVTQVPIPGDFTSIGATFGNHRASQDVTGRGGDLWIRYQNGTLKNLTAAGGFGVSGFQGLTSIAVRDPSVHWSGTKALFSMVVGCTAQQYQTPTWYWQLYEITGLGLAETPVITRIPAQPANANNITPLYGTDDRILFTSDQPLNGQAHLRPQRDEYESAPVVTGLWSLHPTLGDLFMVTHAPSGDYTPIVDSFGRVIFTQWDHFQRDQQADADFNSTGSNSAYGNYGSFNYASEAAGAALLPTRVEVFPEPRTTRPDLLAGTNLVGHTINHFLPWQVNEDGTGLETINHLGRHEFHSYFDRSMTGDPNLSYFFPPSSRPNQNSIVNCFHVKEDPTLPGRYYGIDAQEFGSHSSGQVVRFQAPPTMNPDSLVVDYVTHRATASTTATPTSDHSGLYRDPLPLSDGRVVVAHTSETRQDTNIGTTANPASRYAYRLKLLQTAGAVQVAGTPLTPGITKTISYWSPDVLVSYSGELWEWQPVEVRSRPRPTRRHQVLEAPELLAFQQAGVDPANFQAWLFQQGLAVIVSRDITTRDDADRQQPFNLRVQGTNKQTLGAAGQIYDVAHLQIFQGDLIRGYGGTQNTWSGRRVLAQPLHDPAVQNPANPGGPTGSVAVAPDGSVAAFVPTRRALSWQLTDAAGTGVVRERYWVSFQPGEIRACASCHGINQSSQAGFGPPTNAPMALTQLLQQWSGQTSGGQSLGPAGAGTVVASGQPFPVLRVNGSTGGAARRVDVPLGGPFTISVGQPPALATPAPFVIWGMNGVPSDAMALSTTMGPLAVAPWHLYPSTPGLFVFANSLWADSAAWVPATPAPWTSPTWSLGVPATFTLQGLIQDSTNAADPYGITNGVILSVH